MNETHAVGSMAFDVGGGIAEVSARLIRPAGARWLLLMGHGAGADMHHPFMESLAGMLADRCVASLRYNFPCTENGRKRLG